MGKRGKAVKMTKVQLIEEVSRALEMTLKDSEGIVGAILDGMAHALRAGDGVEIRGFGTFGTRQRKARMGRNPKTGASVAVAAKRVPFFKPGKELKQLVNEGDGSVLPAPEHTNP
jgi:integration host factor subunit beta